MERFFYVVFKVHSVQSVSAFFGVQSTFALKYLMVSQYPPSYDSKERGYTHFLLPSFDSSGCTVYTSIYPLGNLLLIFKTPPRHCHGKFLNLAGP